MVVRNHKKLDLDKMNKKQRVKRVKLIEDFVKQIDELILQGKKFHCIEISHDEFIVDLMVNYPEDTGDTIYQNMNVQTYKGIPLIIPTIPFSIKIILKKMRKG